MLRALIETYLREEGFYSHPWPEDPDRLPLLWGHPEMGNGRYFEDAVAWQMGRESEAAKRLATV